MKAYIPQVIVGDTNGAAPQTALQFQDEGSDLGTAGTVDIVDITGPGVTATRVGNKVTLVFASTAGAAFGFVSILAADAINTFDIYSTALSTITYV